MRQKIGTNKFGGSQVLIPLGIIYKQKLTTLSSTKLRSIKLSVVVKKCVNKKVCLGREKAGRVASPQSPYNRWMSHTIILNRVVIYY